MITNELVQSLWSCPYVEWSYVSSFGASSEILLMWDRMIVSMVEVCQGNFMAACPFRNVDDGME
jgi:hypothetical protein